MRYATFCAGPWPKPGFVAKTLSIVLPRANPDFDSAYQKVTSWWLEIDDNNLVQRELALDATGTPVAAAPLGNNTGIFTDLGKTPDGLGSEVEGQRFEETWKQFESSWLAAKGRQGA